MIQKRYIISQKRRQVSWIVQLIIPLHKAKIDNHNNNNGNNNHKYLKHSCKNKIEYQRLRMTI